MDDTATRVDGENQHCHVLCNPYYTAYFTRSGKDRLTLITLAKKEQLLLVLDHPLLPLHNNPAELGVRQRVRKRDISFGPRSPDGVAAWDTFMTLTETAKKLGVSFYAYVFDRISMAYRLSSLAELIAQTTQDSVHDPIPI